MTAAEVVEALERLQSGTELAKVRKRLPAAEEAIGLRMRDLFDTANAHEGIGLDEVGRLLDHASYEARMAAFCILDFKARRRLDDRQRRDLYDALPHPPRPDHDVGHGRPRRAACDRWIPRRTTALPTGGVGARPPRRWSDGRR